MERVNREIARQSLADFIQQAWRYADASEYVGGWHIDALCEHLEEVSKGELRRLIINIPPRHMKSLSTAVFWPAWTWIKRPGARFLYASYAQSLSIRDSVKCRRVIDSPWYKENWGDRFKLATDQNTKGRFDNDQNGYRLATSVDGALTGEGGDIIVIDDPHNVREGESEAVRNATLSWWDEAMSTRLNNPKTGAYVIIMQRVHENDLVGHILAKEHGWEHLCLPARYEPDHPHVYPMDKRTREGELLWPERFGEEEIERLESALGSYAAAGQLQQRPAPRDGGMFRREWFNIVREAPAEARSVRYWDLAATQVKPGKDPDWTVGCKMSYLDGQYWVEDIRRTRTTPKGVEGLVKQTAELDGKRTRVWIEQEPGSSGKSLISYYQRIILPHYAVRGNAETGPKDIRADTMSAAAEAGNIHLIKADWNNAFLEEMSVFPNGKHDDQADAASGAFRMLARRGGSATVRLTGY